MSVAIVTGSSGLVGSEAVKFFHAQGFEVIGIDNDMRSHFFGPEASVSWNARQLSASLSRFRHLEADIRNAAAMEEIFRVHGRAIEIVVHCAAQPSHDWAMKDPVMDFSVNATGTLILLEATRKHSPEAVFIFTSTNKVYGDTPNLLPLVETDRRWELSSTHAWGTYGIDESMSIDQTKHSLFGASKASADLLVQEYGRYFGLRTVAFRGGCLTGPAHSGTELHGFLAYLVRCAVTGRPYTIFGYKGKQVRDNIHSNDLVQCFWHFFRAPKCGAVYNIGGSRHSNCSMLEAIDLIEEISGDRLRYTVVPDARAGDHIWWISDVRKFQNDYPGWGFTYDLHETLKEIVAAAKDRFT